MAGETGRASRGVGGEWPEEPACGVVGSEARTVGGGLRCRGEMDLVQSLPLAVDKIKLTVLHCSRLLLSHLDAGAFTWQ